MPEWIKTKHKGIRYREHPIRKHGVRRDRYYTIRYKLDGKDREERLGWESDWAKAEQARKEKGEATGRSLEQEAVIRLSVLKGNQSSGKGPRTLREVKAQNDAQRDAEAAKLKADAEAQKTLSEYWEHFYLPAAKRSKKENSWEKEEQHFRLWIGPLLGKLTIRSIGLKQWDELVKTLSNADLSPRMKEYVTGTLRRVLRHGYDRRMVDDPPPTGKRIGISGPGNNRRLRAISYEDEAAIMAELELRDRHAWYLTRFAFLTGCRASEAFNLVWGNIDYSSGCIVFPETKNHDSRTIPLTDPLVELFASMESGAPGVRVVSKEDGTAYSQAPYVFSSVVDKLELNDGRTERDRIVFHSIRHTVATRLAQRLGPRDLMDVMGWRTVQMAMRYVHGNEDAKAKALSTLGSAPKTGRVIDFLNHRST